AVMGNSFREPSINSREFALADTVFAPITSRARPNSLTFIFLSLLRFPGDRTQYSRCAQNCMPLLALQALLHLFARFLMGMRRRTRFLVHFSCQSPPRSKPDPANQFVVIHLPPP